MIPVYALEKVVHKCQITCVLNFAQHYSELFAIEGSSIWDNKYEEKLTFLQVL